MTDEAPKPLPTEIEEDRHWWFAGRTWSLLHMIDRVLRPDGKQRVLDIGCGAGNMFHHLARYGSVMGVDNNPKPLAVARERGYDVREGAAEQLPFGDESFELVSLLDTVEHCEDDLAVLRECYRVCTPGGHLVVTVPALMWLWSHNDELNAHQRRYTARELRDKLNRVGFRVRRMTYNNFLLFPMAAGLILLRRGAAQEPELGSPHFDDESYQVEMEPAPPLMNAFLKSITWSESQLLRWLNLPVGTSIICIAGKPDGVRSRA
jgi:SAM-dependent methyltransferase